MFRLHLLGMYETQQLSCTGVHIMISCLLEKGMGINVCVVVHAGSRVIEGKGIDGLHGLVGKPSPLDVWVSGIF